MTNEDRRPSDVILSKMCQKVFDEELRYHAYMLMESKAITVGIFSHLARRTWRPSGSGIQKRQAREKAVELGLSQAFGEDVGNVGVSTNQGNFDLLFINSLADPQMTGMEMASSSR